MVSVEKTIFNGVWHRITKSKGASYGNDGVLYTEARAYFAGLFAGLNWREQALELFEG